MNDTESDSKHCYIQNHIILNERGTCLVKLLLVWLENFKAVDRRIFLPTAKMLNSISCPGRRSDIVNTSLIETPIIELL